MNSIAEILKFEKTNGELIDFYSCNFCSKKKSKSWLVATFHPFVNEESECQVVVCGDTCRSLLLKNPIVESYLCNCIVNSSAFAGILKPEFENYILYKSLNPDRK